MVEFGQLLVKRWISKTVGSQSGAVKEVISAASYPPLHPLGMLLIPDNLQIPQCTCSASSALSILSKGDHHNLGISCSRQNISVVTFR